MIKTATALFLVLLVFSCKWKADEKVKITEKESPVISSIKESSLPCFKCHSYDKFSANKEGRFSHDRHISLGVHCNQCHEIKAHKGSSVKKGICNNCHKLTVFAYTSSGMPVNFSHQIHADKYSCGKCHPRLFLMKKGASRITMDKINKGSSCGSCHNGQSAFASSECQKCHKQRQ